MKEVTIWDNRPREMWVWDNDLALKERKKVVYLCDVDKVKYPVVALTDGLELGSICLGVFKHCAEIEEPKKRLMSYQELAWWLRDNNRREYKYVNDITGVYFELAYDEDEADVLVDKIVIRENGGEWHEPLVEVEE